MVCRLPASEPPVGAGAGLLAGVVLEDQEAQVDEQVLAIRRAGRQRVAEAGSVPTAPMAWDLQLEQAEPPVRDQKAERPGAGQVWEHGLIHYADHVELGEDDVSLVQLLGEERGR